MLLTCKKTKTSAVSLSGNKKMHAFGPVYTVNDLDTDTYSICIQKNEYNTKTQIAQNRTC